VTFALHGFDAYGLEVAQTAVNAGEEYARSQMGADAEGGDSRHFGKRGKKKAQADGVVGQTKFVLGDFFATDWEEGCGGSGKGFDVVYDYTVSVVSVLRVVTVSSCLVAGLLLCCAMLTCGCR